ncbi:uncharacterized protein LDX57_007863 [Aspergillus melleus]|uniref:uncharacterized protein n=1 Tax=Aspergillus melleus TaxID=138277 RepID=UPI001E8D2F56|nr:uncharacterized protein LDX57_007863 [Aspergillus melleus]KAH8430193.1 hypothetical protein LDX57_007863 [Aspergillus melleus]
MIVKSFFQKPFDEVKKLGPAIVEFDSGTNDEEPKSRVMRAHPTRDVRSLSIFRVLRQKADWKTGLFKVFSSSNSLTEDEFERSTEKDVHEIVLETDELLVLAGSLYIELSPNSGSRIVWQGFSERPMYDDIYSPAALPFMKI